MRTKILEKDDPGYSLSSVKYVAGFDISLSKYNEDKGVASMVVCSFPDLKIVYEKHLLEDIKVPYCPGFLAFKEVPAMTKLWNLFLQDSASFDKPIKVDIVLVDGNGILHCNACGCASHFGVEIDMPTIGCGKTIFAVDGINKTITSEIKEIFRLKSSKKGDFKLLEGKSGRVWGGALKATKDSCDPLIVSVGHRVSIESAIELVNECCKNRVPEPIRMADKISRRIIDKYNEEFLKE